MSEATVTMDDKKRTRINHQIHAPQVRVTLNGNHLGVYSISAALDMAYREGLDLVEIQPGTRPPVCEIMDYSKYRYDQSKKKKSQKTVAMKEIRLRPVSNDHDVDIKIKQVMQFIKEKRTVLVSVMFKARELAHKEQGFRIVQRLLDAVAEVANIDQTPRMEGKRLTARLAPKGN